MTAKHDTDLVADAERLTEALTGSGLTVRGQIALLARITGHLFAQAHRSGLKNEDLSPLYERNMARGTREMHEAIDAHLKRRMN